MLSRTSPPPRRKRYLYAVGRRSWRGRREPELLQHAQPVDDAPLLGHAARLEAHDVHLAPSGRAPGRCGAGERSLVRAARAQVVDDDLAFGDFVLELVAEIREAGSQPLDRLRQA